MSLLAQLAERRQFILYRLVPKDANKLDKIPTHPLTGENIDGQDPAQWMPPAEAALWAAQWNAAIPSGVVGYGVGLVIFEGCGLFCIDLDNCREAHGGWMPHAAAFETMFPGAARETSVSRTGRHIFGSYTGPAPAHATKNKTYRMECYTRARFIAVTGNEAEGSVLTDCTGALSAFLAQYFPPREEAESGIDWTSAPVAAWSGPTDDGELIQRALRSQGIRALAGGAATFADLYTANADVLARVFPSSSNDAFDRSAADMALASHLSFWTGNDCERIERLMRGSGLAREKYDRADYMRGTVLRACASQREFYKGPRSSVPSPPSAPIPSPPTAPAPPPTEGAPHRLTTTPRGDKYEATLPNLVHVLGEQQRTRIGFDTFRWRIMIAPAGTEDWRPLTDTDMINLRERLGRVEGFKDIGKELMRDAFQLVAERHKFDSAITWLNGLVWDGVPRVSTFLTSYCGMLDDEYSRAVSLYIWTGLAARVLDPGCQLDMVVTLVSPQGMHKSTGLQAMVPDPEFFTDGLELHKDDDNFKRLLRGKLVVEIAELAGLSKADVELVKRVITRKHEEWVEKYQTLPTGFPRRALLFASTNNEQFLPKDETGQRRWLPVEIVRIDRDRIAADRNQLWAEGAVLYRQQRTVTPNSGVMWADAERLATGRHAKHEQSDVWTDTIDRWLNAATEDREGVTHVAPGMRAFAVAEVLQGALHILPDRMDKRAEMRVASVLRQLGYAKRKVTVEGKQRERWVRVVATA